MPWPARHALHFMLGGAPGCSSTAHPSESISVALILLSWTQQQKPSPNCGFLSVLRASENNVWSSSTCSCTDKTCCEQQTYSKFGDLLGLLLCFFLPCGRGACPGSNVRGNEHSIMIIHAYPTVFHTSTIGSGHLHSAKRAPTPRNQIKRLSTESIYELNASRSKSGIEHIPTHADELENLRDWYGINRETQTTWWFIPLSKWVITPVKNGISRVNPLITGVITHLLSEMNHQVGIL